MNLEPQTPIVRTERGLSLAGTRITLYDIVAYLEADWPTHLIQHWLNLSKQQMDDALTYLEEHREEVASEYQLILQHAEANRRYWETQNRERLATIALLPPKPGYEAAYEKLQARKLARGGVV